jgi:cell division septal protein FtsQ
MSNKPFQTRARHRPKQHALELRVRSPRIMWLGVLKGLGRVARVVVLLIVAGVAAWGGWLGLKRLFLDNDDFRLQAIELTPNNVIDVVGIVELGGIDLRASVFEVGTAELERRLEARADIISATVERQLPGTLMVSVKERKPVAWLECPARGFSGRDQGSGVLLDADGVLFPCSATLWPHAEALPVLELAAAGDDPLTPGAEVLDPGLRRGLRLVLAAEAAIPADAGWAVERVRVVNGWSLELTTSDGECATFGLTEQARQMADLVTLKRHIAAQGGRIASVNLIPQRNIPVVLGGDAPPRRAIIIEEPAGQPEANPVPPAAETDENSAAPSNRLDRDVRAILNRN